MTEKKKQRNKDNKCSCINEESKIQKYVRKYTKKSSYKDDITVHTIYFVLNKEILLTVQFQQFSGPQSTTVQVRILYVYRHSTNPKPMNKD
jgi:hypothetical protein